MRRKGRNKRWCILYTVYCMLYAVCCILYAVHCMLYTVYCMLYTIYCLGHRAKMKMWVMSIMYDQ